MSIEYHAGHPLLVITVDEIWTKSKALTVQEKASLIIQEKGLNAILLDIRKGSLQGSTTEFYEVISTYTEAYKTEVRLAAILSPEDLKLDDVQFAENVAINRSIPIHIFSDLDQARKWLLVDKSSE